MRRSTDPETQQVYQERDRSSMRKQSHGNLGSRMSAISSLNCLLKSLQSLEDIKQRREVEYLFDRCPNIDMIVRGEGEEIIKQIVTGVPYRDIRGFPIGKTEDRPQRNPSSP